MTILISGPVIGKLCGHTRKWAHDHLRRGSFGPVTEGVGKVLYADRAAVEHATGCAFTDEALAAAVAGYPDRMIVIPTLQPETVEVI